MDKSRNNLGVLLHCERELRLAASVVTVGAFDGVHRGHQELIRQTVGAARNLGVPAIVYTFDTPPKAFFGQAKALISLPEKLERLISLGPDHIIVARFDCKDLMAAASTAETGELGRVCP